jgi:hypothetical protein
MRKFKYTVCDDGVERLKVSIDFNLAPSVVEAIYEFMLQADFVGQTGRKPGKRDIGQFMAAHLTLELPEEIQKAAYRLQHPDQFN